MAKEKRTVDIHGKQYETVASRVERFRKEKDYGINTVLLQNDETLVVMKATIKDGDRIVACGHAEEKRASSQINRTSALENCETSAIGRALACLGYIGTEFASADEVAQAIHQQTQPETKPAYKKPEIVQEAQQEQKQAQETKKYPPASDTDTRPITEGQIKRFFAIGKSVGWAEDEERELINSFGYKHTKDIQRKHYGKIIEMLENGVADIPHNENQADLLKDIKAGSDEKVHESELDQLDEKAIEYKKQLHELTGDDIEYGTILGKFEVSQPYEIKDKEQKNELVTILKDEVARLKKGE